MYWYSLSREIVFSEVMSGEAAGVFTGVEREDVVCAVGAGAFGVCSVCADR